VLPLDENKNVNKKTKNISPDVKDGKMPKWKMQSEMFRNAMKRAKDPDAVVDVEIDDRVQCKLCKRKFAELTYERHVKFCKTQQNKIK